MGLQEDRRSILEMVAEGKIDTDEGVRLLEALGRSQDHQTDEIEARPPARSEHGSVQSVRVVGTFRTLRIVGDPSIQGAVAEGPHRARITDEGQVVFEDFAEGEDEEEGFMLFGPQQGRGRIRLKGEINGREFSINRGVPPALKIRMNPALPLDIDLTAGTARVDGVEGPIRTSMAAGTARFTGVRGPFQAAIDAGSLQIRGLFKQGASEIRCTAGKVRLELDPESSVKISARATLGKISLPKGVEWQGLGGGKREVIIGSGESTLDIEATTGAAVVSMAS